MRNLQIIICFAGSPIKTIDLDLESYTMKRFSDDVTFYWRILWTSMELEGVLVANSTTWVGVGWRPSDLTPACRAFPEINDPPKDEPLPKPEPKSEPEPKPESERGITEGKSKSASNKPLMGELVDEPKAEPEPIPIPEPEHDSERSGAKRRSAKADGTTSVTYRPDDVTVQTSVTYRVSTKQGWHQYHYISFISQ